MSRDIKINIPYNIDVFMAGLCDECEHLHVAIQEGDQSYVELVISKGAATALRDVLNKFLDGKVTEDIEYDPDGPLVQ